MLPQAVIGQTATWGVGGTEMDTVLNVGGNKISHPVSQWLTTKRARILA